MLQLGHPPVALRPDQVVLHLAQRVAPGLGVDRQRPILVDHERPPRVQPDAAARRQPEPHLPHGRSRASFLAGLLVVDPTDTHHLHPRA
eukprot:3462711-Prymnesium_polylepis.1